MNWNAFRVQPLGSIALVALLATQVLAKEMAVQGRLQRTVEAGGWVIVSGGQKYLILNAQRFQNEKWFAEGNGVEAVGETKSGVVTIYMEGLRFKHSTRLTGLSAAGIVDCRLRVGSGRYRSRFRNERLFCNLRRQFRG